MSQANQHKIVILDHNQARRDYLRSMLAARGYRPFLFEKESGCLDNISPLDPDLVISGFESADQAYRFIHCIKSTSRDLPVVILSDNEAISDFITINGFEDICVINENSNPDEMQGAISERLENNAACQGLQDCPLVIGNSPEMIKIKKLIPELNRLNETALIQGERGTGKDLLARLIHFKSDRHDRPFIKVNIPDLFNESIHTDDEARDRSISFQDTGENQKGIFSLADSGTLFLDEIGAMPPRFQVELLNFFKEMQIWNPKQRTHDIRVIASTTGGLEGLVAGGQFRTDLYYRLNVIQIVIPPLRRRMEDIPLLADFFTDKFCHQLGKSHYELSSKTKNIFCSYFWPGNVRELENLVRRIVSQGNEAEVIEKLYLHSENERLWNHHNGYLSAGELEKVKDYVESAETLSLKEVSQKYLNRVEKKLVQKALDSTNWNRRKAAVMLDISYKSLLNKIKEYELTEVQKTADAHETGR